MSRQTYDQFVTFLFTNDLDQTARFYEDKLGLPLVLDQGPCRIYRVAGEAFVGFCSRKEAVTPDGVIVTFVTDDVDGRYEHLSNLGVEFEKPPAMNPKFNIYHCFFRDPNGYLLEIQRFCDPRWPGVSEG